MSVFDELGISVDDLLTPEADGFVPPPPPVSTAKPAQQVVAPKAVVPEVLSDVERRLEKANCYKVLLMDGLFEDAQPGTPAGEVQKEVRDFVRARLETLLGMTKPVNPVKVENQFSQIEATVLKAIVRKLIAQNTPKEPEVISAEEKLGQLVQAMPSEPEPEPEPVSTTPRLRKPRAKKDNQVAAQGAASDLEVKKTENSVTQTVTLPNGQRVELTSKPQARPVGVQPLPTLSPQQAERSYHSLALGHAQSLASNGPVMDIAQKAIKA